MLYYSLYIHFFLFVKKIEKKISRFGREKWNFFRPKPIKKNIKKRLLNKIKRSVRLFCKLFFKYWSEALLREKKVYAVEKPWFYEAFFYRKNLLIFVKLLIYLNQDIFLNFYSFKISKNILITLTYCSNDILCKVIYYIFSISIKFI